MKKIGVFICVLCLAFQSCDDEDESSLPKKDEPVVAEIVSLVKTSSAQLATNSTLSQVLATDAAVVTSDSITYFAIGYRQVTANNQDPILMRFDNGSLTWARTDYENTGDDGTGRGLIYDPNKKMLHVVFTATGTQAGTNYTQFTSNGWLSSYGQGGGAKVVILARIDPTNGNPLAGTYVKAVLSNGNANTVQATGLSYSNQGITLQSNSFFSPLKMDKTRFNCQGSSPFPYTITFDLDLKNALEASATGCN